LDRAVEDGRSALYQRDRRWASLHEHNRLAAGVANAEVEFLASLDFNSQRLQFTLPFGFLSSKSSGPLPQHDSCTANPSGMIKNGKNVVSPFTAISSVQTAQ
jgi:hypothetical protein